MTSRGRPRDYEIVIPPGMDRDLRAHLLTDRTREQMAVVLCGVDRSGERVRLLGRHLITMPADAFSHQSDVGLALDQSVQRRILGVAAREKLSEVDFHTHPGESSTVGFSGIDDRSEQELAGYLARRLPSTVYASVVLNAQASAARVWEVTEGKPPRPVPIPPPASWRAPSAHPTLPFAAERGVLDARFDRQVRAFGPEFQRRLGAFRVGLVGCGGLGSIIVEELTRLGVREWVLVDPDIVEASNLNRLLGATPRDVEEERPKVDVAARTIRQIQPGARIRAIRATLSAPRALARLREAQLLIAATDNDASRLMLNALACQYLIPLVHVGVNLELGSDGRLADMSGEVVIPALGEWCLLCAGVINPQRASWDLARPEERAVLAGNGYLPGTPAPSVYHLNALIASLAVAEVHNVVYPYKPLRRYSVYRELEGDLMTLEVPRREVCLHCGPDGVRGLGDLAPVWRPKTGRSLLAGGLLPAPEPEEEDSPPVEAVGTTTS